VVCWRRTKRFASQASEATWGIGGGANSIEQADVESAIQRLGELLDESVIVDNAEAFKAKQFDAEYKIVQRGRSWDLSQ
jgi:hypothetical protein